MVNYLTLRQIFVVINPYRFGSTYWQRKRDVPHIPAPALLIGGHYYLGG